MTFVEGSILEASVLREALVGVDSVFHLAARVSVLESLRNPAQTHRVNVVGTRAVIEAARVAGVRAVVFTSSCALYGDSAEMPVSESSAPGPLSPYADSKLHAERIGYAQREAGTGFAALRLFNVYGPGQDTGGGYAAVIAAFGRAAAGGVGPTIFGDGLQTRDFVHVDDVVAALICAAEYVGAHGSAGPFNVGTGRAVTLLELWRAVARVTGSDASPAHRPRRPGEIVYSCADVTAIEQELGWTATMGLFDGLRTTLCPRSPAGGDPGGVEAE